MITLMLFQIKESQAKSPQVYRIAFHPLGLTQREGQFPKMMFWMQVQSLKYPKWQYLQEHHLIPHVLIYHRLLAAIARKAEKAVQSAGCHQEHQENPEKVREVKEAKGVHVDFMQLLK